MHEGKGGRKHHKQVQNTRALALTVGHFIKHIAGSEPCTHRGGWESSYARAPKGLGGGSVGVEEEGHDRHRG